MSETPGSIALGLCLAVIVGCAPEPPQPPFVATENEFAPGFTHDNGMTGERYFSEVVGGGGALFDFDNDGDLDVYLVQGGPLGAEARRGPLPSDILMRNDGGSGPAFVDVTTSAGLEATGYGMGVATGDIDGDGFVDLYVTNFGANQLLRNRGDGTFEDVTTPQLAEPRWTTSATFLDYDLDGDLDLFSANYTDYRIAQHRPCLDPTGSVEYCGPASFPPETDRLWRNAGDGTFEDVTGISGLIDTAGSGLGVVSADFNGDGWPDIYVANDLMPNFLWMNQGDGTFREDALLAGCAINESGAPEASMGLAVADFDRDGDEDLFMTHLDTETNTAYANEGNGLFVDVSNEWGLSIPSLGLTGFGTAAIDFDNDGWPDIVASNGAVKTIADQRRAGDPLPLRERDLLLHNEAGAFREVTDTVPELMVPDVGRGLATGDIDNDGDDDLLLLNNNGPAQLLENRIGQAGLWIGIDLAASGLGTLATLESTAGRLHRSARSGQSYCSASDWRLRLGGADRTANRITLTSGRRPTRRLEGVPSGHYLRLPG